MEKYRFFIFFSFFGFYSFFNFSTFFEKNEKTETTEKTEKTEKPYLADRYILWKHIVFSVFFFFSFGLFRFWMLDVSHWQSLVEGSQPSR